MKNFSIRLTDVQIKNIEKLAQLEEKKPNQIIRDLLEIGIKEKELLRPDKERLQFIPAFEILSTRASIESLLLLREIAKTISPELIEIAKKLAGQKVQESDLAELISQ